MDRDFVLLIFAASIVVAVVDFLTNENPRVFLFLLILLIVVLGWYLQDRKRTEPS